MIKTVEVCDLCEQDKPLIKCDLYNYWSDCGKLYYNAKAVAMNQLNDEVMFFTTNASNIAYFVKNVRNPEKQWGTQGMELRDKFIKELEKIGH